MRIATYNTEWFSELVGTDNQLLYDNEASHRYRTTRREQLEALGQVFQALDADAILLVEAPESGKKKSTVAALENFATDFKLRANKVVHGFGNDTKQEIALMYDPNELAAIHKPMGGAPPLAPQFDETFQVDLDVDGSSDSVRFSKPPLEVLMTTKAGREINLIGVHAKSKAPYGAKTKAEETRISIENRRKQLAQCIWVRKRVLEHFERNQHVIVLGDFNDGPGLDEFEKLFGRSGVEIVLGETGDNCLFDPNANMGLTRKFGGLPTTSRFYLGHEKRFFGALLDYIMVPESLREEGPEWRIWHPFDDPNIYKNPTLREALLTASDHFPVTLDLNL